MGRTKRINKTVPNCSFSIDIFRTIIGKRRYELNNFIYEETQVRSFSNMTFCTELDYRMRFFSLYKFIRCQWPKNIAVLRRSRRFTSSLTSARIFFCAFASFVKLLMLILTHERSISNKNKFNHEIKCILLIKLLCALKMYYVLKNHQRFMSSIVKTYHLKIVLTKQYTTKSETG